MSRCSACHASGLNTSVSIYWQSGHGKYSSIEARCWQLQTRWVIILQLAMHLEETISARLNHTEVEGRQFPGPCPCPLYCIWPTSDKSESDECCGCPSSSVTSVPALTWPHTAPLLPPKCRSLVTGYLRSVTAPVSGKPGPSASPGLPAHHWPLTGDQRQCVRCQVPSSSQLPWDPP